MDNDGVPGISDLDEVGDKEGLDLSKHIKKAEKSR